MASDRVWEKVKKYFPKDSKIDNWGDKNAISDQSLLSMFYLRDHLGMPIYILRGAETSGHSESSFHYRKEIRDVTIEPCAVDFFVPDYADSPFDFVLDCTRFFNGFGFYPDWVRHGRQGFGGHGDMRPVMYKRAQWMGIKNDKNKQIYIDLNFHNILKHSQHLMDDWDGLEH